MLSFLYLIASLFLLNFTIQTNQEFKILSFIQITEEENNTNGNLKEWLSNLIITLPNEIIENTTKGIVENISIYGIFLDKLITTNPERINNKISLNFSIENVAVKIKGIYNLINKNQFDAYISKLNIKIPLVLLLDSESELVSEVDTNGLNLDLDNIEIELDLNYGDFLNDIIMSILKEILLALKEDVIEKSLVEFLNLKIGNLFQILNNMIKNSVFPKQLNISIDDEELINLKKSNLISTVGYILNNLTGINGPLNINSLINIITNNTGIINLKNFYSENIIFNLNLTNINSIFSGNLEIILEDINITGLNTWKNFTALVPYDKVLLYSYLNLKNLSVNASFYIKLKLDNNSNIQTNETTLHEKAVLKSKFENNQLEALIQIPLNNKKLNEYSNKECLNYECFLNLIDPNGAGISSLYLNENFNNIEIEGDEEENLEKDLFDTINKLNNLVGLIFGDNINLLINSFMNSTIINFINAQINNYLYSKNCPKIPDSENSEVHKLATIICSVSLFVLFILIIFFPYILGKYYKQNNYELNEKNIKNNNKQINIDKETNFSQNLDENNLEIKEKYLFPNISIKWVREFGRIDDTGASLFLNRKIHLFWRIFIPLSIIVTLALFFSSKSGYGATVYLLFKIDRRIEMPPIDKLELKSIKNMWEEKVYFLCLLEGALSLVWPFIKLFLMIIAFIIPTSIINKKYRKKFLLILDATGKWSLYDLFYLVFLIVGIHFEFNFPVNPPSEAERSSKFDNIVYFAYGYVSMIIGTILSTIISHIMKFLERSLDNHPDENKGEKAENYIPLIYFAKNKYLGNTIYRICITFLLFSTIILIFIGSFTNILSINYYGLISFAFDLLNMGTERIFNFFEIGLKIRDYSENPNQPAAILIQFVYFITIFIMPIAVIISLIILWFIPLPRKVQKLCYSIVEIFNSFSCLDVFILSMIVSIIQFPKYIEGTIGKKCESINPYIEKYLNTFLDGHNSCFEMNSYTKEGVWILLIAAIIFLIISNLVMIVCRNSLNERLPNHVKEYLQLEKEEEKLQNENDDKPKNDDLNKRETLIQPNDIDIGNINSARSTVEILKEKN